MANCVPNTPTRVAVMKHPTKTSAEFRRMTTHVLLRHPSTGEYLHWSGERTTKDVGQAWRGTPEQRTKLTDAKPELRAYTPVRFKDA